MACFKVLLEASTWRRPDEFLNLFEIDVIVSGVLVLVSSLMMCVMWR